MKEQFDSTILNRCRERALLRAAIFDCPSISMRPFGPEESSGPELRKQAAGGAMAEFQAYADVWVGHRQTVERCYVIDGIWWLSPLVSFIQITQALAIDTAHELA